MTAVLIFFKCLIYFSKNYEIILFITVTAILSKELVLFGVACIARLGRFFEGMREQSKWLENQATLNCGGKLESR